MWRQSFIMQDGGHVNSEGQITLHYLLRRFFVFLLFTHLTKHISFYCYKYKSINPHRLWNKHDTCQYVVLFVAWLVKHKQKLNSTSSMSTKGSSGRGGGNTINKSVNQNTSSSVTVHFACNQLEIYFWSLNKLVDFGRGGGVGGCHRCGWNRWTCPCAYDVSLTSERLGSHCFKSVLKQDPHSHMCNNY